ncbi:MAG: response regulator [Candidatus Cloacimonetes bacterium]|nr:response regulator [Candidatus Cloacimonadota bacterium]
MSSLNIVYYEFEPRKQRNPSTIIEGDIGDIEFHCPSMLLEFKSLIGKLDNVSLLFLDSSCPDYSTQHFLYGFKKIFPDAKVVIFNSKGSAEHLEHIVYSGVKCFVPEEFLPNDLHGMCYKVLGLDYVKKEDRHYYKGKILIIDEEVNLVKLLETFLSQFGYEITSVTDASTIATVLQNDNFNLVLMDVDIKSFPALDLLKTIKSHDEETFVCGMDWFGNKEKERVLVNAGAYKVLKKPFELHILAQLLGKLIFRSSNEEIQVDYSKTLKKGNGIKNNLMLLSMVCVVTVLSFAVAESLLKEREVEQVKKPQNPLNHPIVLQMMQQPVDADIEKIKQKLGSR